MTTQVHRAYIPVVIFFVMHFVLKKLSIIQCRFGFKNMFCVVKFCMFSFFPKNKYYERLAARIERQRDEAEEERIRELTKKMEREKEKALSDQWEECERIKKEAIEEACIALTKKLRNEFVLEKEKAIAEALKIQKVKDQFL